MGRVIPHSDLGALSKGFAGMALSGTDGEGLIQAAGAEASDEEEALFLAQDLDGELIEPWQDGDSARGTSATLLELPGPARVSRTLRRAS